MSGSKNLYYIFFFIVIVSYNLRAIGVENADYLVYTVVPLVLIKIIYTKYKSYELWIIALLIGCFCLSAFTSKHMSLLVTAFTIIGMKDIEYRKLLKISFNVTITCFFITIFATATGLLDTKVITQIRDKTQIIRSSMGYNHPNTAALIFFIILCLYFLLYSSKNTAKITWLISVIAGTFIYYITYSRTGLIMSMIFLVLILLSKYYVFKKIIIYISLIMPLLCMAISWIMPMYLDKISIFSQINSKLQYRFTYSKIYISEFSINLFGNNTSDVDISTVLDSGYITLIIKFGIVITVLYFIAYYLLIKKAIKEDNMMILVISIVISIYWVSEVWIYSIFYNILLILFGDILYKNRNQYVIQKEGNNTFQVNKRKKCIRTENIYGVQTTNQFIYPHKAAN